MVFTVAEAKDKMFCPFQQETETCWTEHCPMWRWAEMVPNEWTEEDLDGTHRPNEQWNWDDTECRWYLPHPEQRRGFCGLPGRPEFWR